MTSKWLSVRNMESFDQKIQKADRLDEISKRVGFALWQLQELEGVAVQYFVLLVQAKKGMGLAEGTALVEKAQSNTFGGLGLKVDFPGKFYF